MTCPVCGCSNVDIRITAVMETKADGSWSIPPDMIEHEYVLYCHDCHYDHADGEEESVTRHDAKPKPKVHPC